MKQPEETRIAIFNIQKQYLKNAVDELTNYDISSSQWDRRVVDVFNFPGREDVAVVVVRLTVRSGTPISYVRLNQFEAHIPGVTDFDERERKRNLEKYETSEK